MKSIKPGRGPSMMGVVMGIVAALFGVLWIAGAMSMTSGMDSFTFYEDPMMSAFDAIFPLFGVLFVIAAIAGVVYNYKNATGKNRYSEFDVVDGDEEPDPLNERFGEHKDGEKERHAGAFCPYCGNEIEGDHLYCDRCGKKLRSRG
ncbi:MAG: zinc-ribbon domain-containing protein [Clostridia bacterium]|nr:zinc-ribbon domain-containing protein [Clostridia bacterium]